MNYKNKEDIGRYVGWLEDELIPDLKESGMMATAFDFERCVRIIRDNGLVVETPTMPLSTSTTAEMIRSTRREES